MSRYEQETQKRLKELQKKKKIPFLVPWMWISTFLSTIYPERIKIPDDIGNNIIIDNSSFTTKNSITSLIMINYFSTLTPVGFVDELIRYVRSSVKGVRVDVKFRMFNYDPKITDVGLRDRVRIWEDVLTNEKASPEAIEAASVSLLSYEKMKRMDGELYYRVYPYIMLRAKDGHTLATAKKVCTGYLNSLKIQHTVIKSNMELHLSFINSMSDNVNEKMRDFQSVIMSGTSIAEVLPTTQGLNAKKGVLLGVTSDKTPYLVDFKKSAAGKTIYVPGATGTGKTFMVTAWLTDFASKGYRACIWDYKGNEFIPFVKGTNGITVSFKADATKFINTFKLDPNTNDSPTDYFNARKGYSKQLMTLMVSPTKEEAATVDLIIEGFLKNLYLTKGILAENKNTWSRSNTLHPYVVYEFLLKYMSSEMRETYGLITTSILDRIGIYWNRSGSMSHMFRDEFTFEDVYKSSTISFDFGMNEGHTSISQVALDIKYLFASIIAERYCSYNKLNNYWTVEVCEESQIAGPYLLAMYAKSVTMGRSLQKITIVLGNSVASLTNSEDGQKIIDNIKILVIGSVSPTERELLINKFALDNHRDDLADIYNNQVDNEHKFLIDNKMTADQENAIIRVEVPKSVVNSKLFKMMELENE